MDWTNSGQGPMGRHREYRNLEGCALDSDKCIDRDRLRVFWKSGQLVEQADTVHVALPHANDAPSTHRDASITHIRQGFKPVLARSSKPS